MIDTIRTGLYPQLDKRVHHQIVFDHAAGNMAVRDEIMEDSMVMAEPEMMQQAPMVKPSAPRPKLSSKMVARSYLGNAPIKQARKQMPKADLTSIDPNSMVQTGPGLPNWSAYQQTRLQWSGPVKADETSRLILINPFINMLLKFLGIGLLLGLC